MFCVEPQKVLLAAGALAGAGALALATQEDLWLQEGPKEKEVTENMSGAESSAKERK